MKERAIVVCAGSLWKRNLEAIKGAFEIVALADNYKNGEIVDEYQCIGIKEIQLYDYDRVIICSVLYESVIREQLIESGVESSKVYDIGSMDKQLYFEKDMQKYNTDKSAYMEECQKRKIRDFLYDAKNELPKLADYRDHAGNIDAHYFLMDIMMAREVIKRKPAKHFDIGSRVEGFISHLLVGNIDVTVIDIRPLCEMNPGGGIQALNFMQADATNLDKIPDHAVESLSALHSIEHFGLGRYGDDIDPEAHLKAMRAMVRVLSDNGYLYFAVPVGSEEKLCFNAHRIFSPLTVLECFKELKLEKMWLLHDMKFYEYSIEELRAEKYRGVIGRYDCGLYIFQKA